MDHTTALLRDVEDLKHDVYGNGKPGLIADVRDIKRALYKNEDTGAPGLVKDVADIKTMVIEIRGAKKAGSAAWWVIGAALVIVQLLDKLGAFALSIP